MIVKSRLGDASAQFGLDEPSGYFDFAKLNTNLHVSSYVYQQNI